MKKIIPIAIAIIFVLIVAFRVQGAQETCQKDNGWVKIDSDDLSLYPVAGATQYCFKAGSDNSQGCTGGIFTSWPQPAGTCGLSHWAYFIGTVTPTPQITPTIAITPTAGPSVTPTIVNSPTPAPTRIVTPTASPTGVQPTSNPSKVEEDKTPGPQPQGTDQMQGRGNPELGILK